MTSFPSLISQMKTKRAGKLRDTGLSCSKSRPQANGYTPEGPRPPVPAALSESPLFMGHPTFQLAGSCVTDLFSGLSMNPFCLRRQNSSSLAGCLLFYHKWFFETELSVPKDRKTHPNHSVVSPCEFREMSEPFLSCWGLCHATPLVLVI